MNKNKKNKKHIKTLNFLINQTNYISFTKFGIGEFLSILKMNK
jgi:hypothetical protein